MASALLGYLLLETHFIDLLVANIIAGVFVPLSRVVVVIRVLFSLANDIDQAWLLVDIKRTLGLVVVAIKRVCSREVRLAVLRRGGQLFSEDRVVDHHGAVAINEVAEDSVLTVTTHYASVLLDFDICHDMVSFGTQIVKDSLYSAGDAA